MRLPADYISLCVSYVMVMIMLLAKPSIGFVALLCSIIIVVLCAVCLKPCLWLAVWLVVSILWFLLHWGVWQAIHIPQPQYQQLTHHRSTAVAGENKHYVRFFISSIIHQQQQHMGFIIGINQILQPNQPTYRYRWLLAFQWPRYMLFNCYHTCWRYQPGSYWLAHLHIKAIHIRSNPYSIPRTYWFVSKHIIAQAHSVQQAQFLAYHPSLQQRWSHWIQRQFHKPFYHRHLEISNQHAVFSRRSQAFLSAILTGSHSQLTQHDWQVLQAAGCNHLLAVAGLHLGFFFMLCLVVVDRLVRQFPWLLRHMPAQYWARYTALLFSMLYAYLSGWSLPTQRAWLLCVIALLSMSCRFFINSSTWQQRLGCVALCIAISQPWLLGGVSFYLSFTAVYAIGCAFKQPTPQWVTADNTVVQYQSEPQQTVSTDGYVLNKRWQAVKHAVKLGFLSNNMIIHLLALWQNIMTNWLLFFTDRWIKPRHMIARYFRHYVVIQWYLTAALLPFAVLFFHNLSWLSMPCNMVFVPYFSCVILPLSILWLLSIPMTSWHYVLSRGLNSIIMTLWHMLDIIFEYCHPLYHLNLSNWLQFVFMLGCVWLFLHSKSFWQQVMMVGLLLVITLYWPRPWIRQPAFGYIRLINCDVGHGQAIVIRTQHHVVLFDCGPAYPQAFNAARDVIAPILYAWKINRLDVVILSATTRPYAAGYDYIKHHFTVVHSYYSYDSQKKWTYDGVLFRFISLGSYAHDRFAVLKVQSHHRRILIFGRISQHNFNTWRFVIKNQSPTAIIPPNLGLNHSFNRAIQIDIPHAKLL